MHATLKLIYGNQNLYSLRGFTTLLFKTKQCEKHETALKEK